MKTFKDIVENYSYLNNPEYKNKSVFTIHNRQVEAETVYSHYYQSFFTISKNYKNIIGKANTPKDSQLAFINLMENYFNNLSKRGRRKKTNVPFGCNIPEDIKQFIDSFCLQHKINQGEYIAELVKSHRANLASYYNSKHHKRRG